MRNHVLDNRDFMVVDYLREHLADADEFSILHQYCRPADSELAASNRPGRHRTA